MLLGASTNVSALEGVFAAFINGFAVLGFFVTFFSGLLGALALGRKTPTHGITHLTAVGIGVGFYVGLIPFVATLLIQVSLIDK